MGADIPDWGGQYNSGAFFPLFDMAELAVRLGSPISFDRRGAVIWFYDFFYGVDKFGEVGGANGGSVALSTAKWYTPPFSCLLTSGTSVGDNEGIREDFDVPQTTRVGFAAHYATGAFRDVRHTLIFDDGDTEYIGQVTWNVDASPDVYIATPSGNVSIVSQLPSGFGGGDFAFIKLVIDITTQKYERLVWQGLDIDLSAYSLDTAASGSRRLRLESEVISGAGGSGWSAYVDQWVLTALEPAN